MKRHILFLFSALLFLSVSCQTSTTIATNLPEREANEIVVLLASKGIGAQKTAASTGATGTTTDQTWDIMVPSSQITDALAILNQSGLPRVQSSNLLDIFGTSGLVPSDLQDKIRYQEGLSAQLANTIRKMDGIIDANVQITFPTDDDDDTKEALTASVYVKHRGILDNPNSLTITKIKRLVSSAIPGLTADNVSVVTDRALYADISLQPLEQMQLEQSYVSVWGLVVAKASVTRFRLVFYCFIIVIFLLACALAWMVWKYWPAINSRGMKSLISPHQYDPEAPASTPEAPSEGEGGE